MKNVLKLQHYYFPSELEAALKDFVVYYNNVRYHESPDNVTQADVYFGRRYEALSERSKITMERKNKEYLAKQAAWSKTTSCLLAEGVRCPDQFADVHLSVGSGRQTTESGASTISRQQ